MGRVSATQEVVGPLDAAERLWYDTSRWSAFIDGFARVVEATGAWPGPGSRVVWESTPAGRGRVVERVVDQRPGDGQEVRVEDPRLTGTQRIGFSALEDSVEIDLELEYQLVQGGPFGGIVDLLFVRRALRDSLRRTLERFALTLEDGRAS
jgi:hypothetical protein